MKEEKEIENLLSYPHGKAQLEFLRVLEEHDCLKNLKEEQDYYGWYECAICTKRFPPWTFLPEPESNR